MGERGGLQAFVLLLSALLAVSCGYHAVYGGEAPARMHVKLVRSLVPDVVASDEVASGVREELLREGALEPGEGWPRAEIEVLRASGSSEGVAARGSLPFARGIDVGIVGRAWIAPEPGTPPEHDTGDMRAEEVIAVDETLGVADPLSNEFHQADALRAAARRLGRKLGRKLMGRPAASEEGDL
jgi:hypothetical protein